MPLTPGVHLLHPTVVAHVLDAPEGGPTALVQAGIHGDEIAGVHALEELLEEGLRPARGRLIVVPVMNPAAYRARQRAAPGGLDLNRSFPGDPDAPAVESRLAARFMALIRDERPALVATLHESHKRYDPEVQPSFGQSIVYGVRPCPAAFTRVVERLNAELPHEDERWATHHFPVATSSTEVIVDDIGCLGTCVETWMGFDVDRRVQMQKRVVELLLDEVGVGFTRG
jgi:hypothetical protein